jgi:hypothetical protein
MINKKVIDNTESDIDRLQAQDVYDYLQKLKHFGARGQTSKEICSYFFGIISERAVLKQLQRLTKGKYVKQIRVKVGANKMIIYEAK